MKIKVFTTDQKGYITLTQKELQELLNEAYWEGYNEGNRSIPTYPNRPNPYYWTTATNGNVTLLNNPDVTNNIKNITPTVTTTTGNLSIKSEDMKPYSISYDTKTRGK
jgi:hypothetical protein